jgi:UPF0716 family protein affecting phage T7 exclusion
MSGVRALLAIFAAVQVLLGAGLWLTPGFFHDEIGPLLLGWMLRAEAEAPTR